MLEKNLGIWTGEFGRMPQINLTGGRDHFPSAFNLALAGCGVKGGQIIGATDKLGSAVAERPVSVPDLFCTFCQILGIDPRKETQTNVARPTPLCKTRQASKESLGSSTA